MHDSVIEYFYAAHSAFAYLGSARLMSIAKRAGRKVVHRPIDLGRVVEAAGAGPFRTRSKAHVAYFFGREVQRWSEQRNAPVVDGVPTHHFKDTTLPNCALIAADTAGLNVDVLSHALLESHWRHDADLSDIVTLTTILQSVGIDANAVLEAAVKSEVVERYAQYTNEAIERSVFGSPTYFLDADMFYGQDRLEMVERALTQPYQ